MYWQNVQDRYNMLRGIVEARRAKETDATRKTFDLGFLEGMRKVLEIMVEVRAESEKGE